MSQINVLSHINFKKNQALNMNLHQMATHPSNVDDSYIYYNTTDATVYVRANGAWLDLGYYINQSYTPYNTTFTGAQVLSVLETDTAGNVVNMGTRLLTLADLGFTGNPNGYTHPTFTNSSTGTLTGATVIEKVTVNNEGHVTEITTRQLTAANIGAAPTSHTHTISQISDLTATASEINNATDLSAIAGAAGFTYTMDSPTTATWRRIKTSELENDLQFVVIDDNNVSNTTVYSSDKIEDIVTQLNSNIGNAVTGALINQGGFTPTTSSSAPVPVTSTTIKNGMVWVFTGVSDFDWNGTKVDSGDMLVANRDNADPTYPNHWTIVNKNIPAIVSATTSVQGIIQLATDVEVNAGTNAIKAVTPATLNQRTATESRTGLAEIATQAETNTGTDDSRFITPLKLKTYVTSFVGGYSISIGDGSALNHDILHNLGTTDLVVQVYENATNEEVLVSVKKISVNEVRISTNVPMGLNEYRVVIKK